MSRSEIVIVERPESVSWEQISALLQKAHAQNVANGIKLRYPFLPPEELEAKTEGAGGKVLVALKGDELVGVGAVKVVNMDLWCGGGQYAYCFLDAVLPDFAGQGIYRRISEEQERLARKWGVNRMLFDSHEGNKRIQEISRKNGYRLVEFRVRENYNSVIMVKWLDGSPYSRMKCAYVFWRRRSDKLKRKNK